MCIYGRWVHNSPTDSHSCTLNDTLIHAHWMDPMLGHTHTGTHTHMKNGPTATPSGAMLLHTQ